MMVDTLQIVYEWAATAGTGLYTLVGTRIYTALPAGFDNTSACVVMTLASEGAHFTGRDRASQVNLRFFGGSANHADVRSVYRAWWDRFHGVVNKTTATGRLLSAEQVTAQVGLKDPETGFCYGIGVYAVMVD